jgi:uncharacterized protein
MTMSKFVWFEYVGGDTQKAKGFFGELFGWTTQAVPMPEGAYEMIASGGRTIGGYSTSKDPAHWLTHLHTTDAKATSEHAAKLGGKIVKPAFKVGEFGTMALVADPQGGTFALWQPAKAEEAPKPTTGTFCWNELASSDPAASVKFYAAVGGFTDKAMEMEGMGAYHVLESANEPRAGIVAKMMPQQPHAWLPYVQVASADKTSEKAKKLGGAIVVPPTDVANVGRFSIVVDTQGAAIGILQP